MKFILKAKPKDRKLDGRDWFVPPWVKPQDINEIYRVLERDADKNNYDWMIEHIAE